MRGCVDEFFAAEYEGVVRSLTMVFGDRSQAEDSAQVGFERALRRWSAVELMDRPGTWVYVVAMRHGWRDLRRLERRRRFDAATATEGPESGVVDAVWVAGAIERLPPRQRAAVVLRHGAGLRLSEVAETLGVTTGSIKSSLHAAYASLRVELATEIEESEPNAN